MNLPQISSILLIALLSMGCMPRQSVQPVRGSATMVKGNSMMRVLYQNQYYAVFYDEVLKRCIVYQQKRSANFGRNVGLGLALHTFPCNPTQIVQSVNRFRKVTSPETKDEPPSL